MLARMAKELDPDVDKDEIERLREKQAAAQRALQESKPSLTQHTNAGHKLAELEARQTALAKRLEQQRKLVEEAQALEKQLESQAEELAKDITKAKQLLVDTLPVPVPAPRWGLSAIGQDELA